MVHPAPPRLASHAAPPRPGALGPLSWHSEHLLRTRNQDRHSGQGLRTGNRDRDSGQGAKEARVGEGQLPSVLFLSLLMLEREGLAKAACGPSPRLPAPSFLPPLWSQISLLPCHPFPSLLLCPAHPAAPQGSPTSPSSCEGIFEKQGRAAGICQEPAPLHFRREESSLRSSLPLSAPDWAQTAPSQLVRCSNIPKGL